MAWPTWPTAFNLGTVERTIKSVGMFEGGCVLTLHISSNGRMRILNSLSSSAPKLTSYLLAEDILAGTLRYLSVKSRWSYIRERRYVVEGISII